jgi:hypothetical protein
MTKDEALAFDLALEALEREEYRLRQTGQSQVYSGIGFAITAIKQARSAPVQEPDLIARLKHPEDHYECTDPKKANAVLMSLCQEAADALAAPVQEPVAVTYKEVADTMNALWGGTLKQVQIAMELANKKLYTTPPAQRQWVGLTDEERMEIYNKPLTIASCIGAVEAKLKEKNT